MLLKSHLWPGEMAQWVQAPTVQVRGPEFEPHNQRKIRPTM